PTPDYLRIFRKLVRPRGVLISSNLHFRDAETRAYRDLLFAGGGWLTAAIAGGDTAMSGRLWRQRPPGCVLGPGSSKGGPASPMHPPLCTTSTPPPPPSTQASP